MARAATTADVFNAVGEPRRRRILDVLAGGKRPVGDIVEAVGLPQSQVSKHLRVLREVGLVDVQVDGRQRVYSFEGRALEPIFAWVQQYAYLWNERFDALDEVLETLVAQRGRDDDDDAS